ncbi:MAG: hypothetical protein KJ574_02470, partial [Nanoarchaeota archaeon]|nr:hypothetical protein [Nanoarchaeota archaeon]
MGLFGIFRKKQPKQGIERLEELLDHRDVPSEYQTRQTRREFLKEMGVLVATITVLGGSCGTCIKVFGRKIEEPRPNRAMDTVEKEGYYQSIIAQYSSQIEQISQEENVPEYILEGMVLASSTANSYSLHQRQEGLGGVVLLD